LKINHTTTNYLRKKRNNKYVYGLKEFLRNCMEIEKILDLNYTNEEKEKINRIKNGKKNKSPGNIRKNGFKNF
jgi:hypothetical protein